MTAIVTGELLYKYSVSTGAAGDATASSALASLGKYMSTSAWAGGAANDLFTDITGAENSASQVDYSCVFIHNSNASNDLVNAVVYLSADVAGGATIAIATDNIAASIITSASAQSDLIASSVTAPTGVSAFSAPTTLGTGLSLGTIPSGYCKAIWIKRSAANTVALSGDGFTIAVGGDTGSL